MARGFAVAAIVVAKCPIASLRTKSKEVTTLGRAWRIGSYCSWVGLDRNDSLLVADH